MRHDERGQALVEFALMMPFLVMLLCGVVYCGGLVAAQQNMAIAARHAARSMALDGTLKGLQSKVGVGGVASAAVARNAVAKAAPGKAYAVKGVNWNAFGTRKVYGSGNTGRFVETGGFTLPKFGALKCGIGVALYGATVTKSLAGDMSPIGRLASNMAPKEGLAGKLLPELSATAVMPAELPIRGSAGSEGVLDLNPWITKIAGRRPEPVPIR